MKSSNNKTLSKLTSVSAVNQAIAEFDELGREIFLKKYGFWKARNYFLIVNKKPYDSKAIIGVAFGYQFPNQGPLKSKQFNGGENTVRRKLESLGFTVKMVDFFSSL